MAEDRLIEDIVAEAQESADAMRSAAVELSPTMPVIASMLEASARILEAMCDHVMDGRRPSGDGHG